MGRFIIRRPPTPPFACATPTFSPGAGNYSSAQSVVPACSTPSSTLWYTTDNSTPAVISGVPQGTTQQYTGTPISISANTVLQAIATAPGFNTSAVATASYTFGAIAALPKFAPGHYGLAGNKLYNTPVFAASGGSALADINEMLSAGAIAAGLRGYTWGAQWTTYDKSTTASSPVYDFSTFWQIANLLQALWPGAIPRHRFSANHYAQNVTAAQISAANMGGGGNDGFFVPHALQSCGGSITVPNSFGSGSTTTYAVAACYSGSPNYGMNFQDNNGAGGFKTVTPQYYNPGASRMIANCIQAFFANVCPNPTLYSAGVSYSAGMTVFSGPNTYTYINNTAAAGVAVTDTTHWKQVTSTYAGQTPDQILYGWGRNDEISNAFISSDNISGITVNPPLSVTGAAPTNTNFWTQEILTQQITRAAAPTTPTNSLPTTGWGAGSSVDSSQNTAANVNGNCPSANRSAASALSSIQGWVLSAADTFGFEFLSTNNWANNGKQGFFGIVSPGAAAGTLPTPTVANLIGVKHVVSQVQALDFFTRVSGAGNNASAVTQILTAGEKLHSQVFEWCLIDETNNFPSYLFSTLAANPLPSICFQRPTDLMVPVTINSVSVASPTSLSIDFHTYVLDSKEQGLQFDIIRDGVKVASTASSPFVDSGLTTGVLHDYQVRMSNLNGPGPVGPIVSGAA